MWPSQQSNVIHVATKPMTEQLILGDMLKLLIEQDTDLTVELLKGIDIVYFTNIGAIAAAKIINNGIFPIKYKGTVSIEEEIKKLTAMLNTNPPPFIKKIIEKKAA